MTGIVLKISHFPRAFGGFLERIPAKNGEATPRSRVKQKAKSKKSKWLYTPSSRVLAGKAHQDPWNEFEETKSPVGLKIGNGCHPRPCNEPSKARQLPPRFPRFVEAPTPPFGLRATEATAATAGPAISGHFPDLGDVPTQSKKAEAAGSRIQGASGDVWFLGGGVHEVALICAKGGFAAVFLIFCEWEGRERCRPRDLGFSLARQGARKPLSSVGASFRWFLKAERRPAVCEGFQL